MKSLVKIAKMFSDENRVRIIALIQREGNVCVCEVCDTLQLSQPLVSRHLKQLGEADVLTSSRSGKWRYYAINPKPSPLLQSLLDTLKAFHDTLPPLCACKATVAATE